MATASARDLVALRQRADALADDVIAALAASSAADSGNVRRVGAAGGAAATRADTLTLVRARAAAGDACCRTFLERTAADPVWLDRRAFVDGRRAATRQAPLTFLVLLVGSLVESFAIADGAAVLVRTGRLARDGRRRIYETATLVRELLLDDEERPGGRAHEALLRVRLLHARVRRWLTHAPSAGDPWDRERRGVPVNQMDMLHTLLMFSRVVAAGVGALGGSFTRDERASWCALWRYAGHVIGVDDDVCFRNVDDEDAAYAAVRSHYAPDDGSRLLAHAVLDALARQPPFFLPRAALDELAARVLGDELAARFSLQRSRRWHALARAAFAGTRALDLAGRTAPSVVGVAAGRAFIEVNRWRVLRTMTPAGFGFRTA